jgi:hypothetical protein
MVADSDRDQTSWHEAIIALYRAKENDNSKVGCLSKD